MWPMRLEMTRDECRKCLRYLELDAYGSIVSVLRAQGPFTSEKQKLLQEIAKMLNISNERHRAEIRRAVNDEKLATIAEQLNGPNTGTDWTIEGRRTIALLPRLKARSAFTTLANSLSLAAAVANTKSPSRRVTSRPIENFTAAESARSNQAQSTPSIQSIETESQSEVKIEEDSSVDTISVDTISLDATSVDTTSLDVTSVDITSVDTTSIDISVDTTSIDITSVDTTSVDTSVDTFIDTFVDNKLCNPENEFGDTKILQKSSNASKNEDAPDNKDAEEKVNKALKTSKLLGKRKSPSLLPVALPNKVRVVSSESLETPNHTDTNKRMVKNDVQEPQTTACHQNVKLIPLNVEISGSRENKVSGSSIVDRPLVPANKHTSTIIPACTSNANKPKTIVSFVQNKLSTNIIPVTSSDTSNLTLNKVQAENSERSDVQMQDNTNDTQKNEKSESTSLSCIKRVPVVHTNINTKPIISKSVISSNTHRVMAVHPGTMVSSGPGPPQAKQATPLLTYKKWPSEQNATFSSQSTAKMEVLGKVIMGRKNLCVTSQHNVSSASVLPHHVSLNGDQTTTTLTSTHQPNAESVKTNIMSGNTIVFNLRQDVLQKKKVLSQRLDSSGVLNSEPKTVIQSRYTRLSTENANDASTIDKESSLKTDASIISTTDEHSKNENINASVNSQITQVNSLDASKAPGAEEILIKSTQPASVQDDAENDIRTRESNKDVDTVDATLNDKPADANLESLQHSETDTVNHVDERDDS